MSLGLDDPGVMERFDEVCKVVLARGRGITLAQLGACHALARELSADAPDSGRIGDHAFALGIDVDELGLGCNEGVG